MKESISKANTAIDDPHATPCALAIFEKDGTPFTFCHPDFIGKDRDEAWKIGIGAIPECVVVGARFTGDTVGATVTDDGVVTFNAPVQTGRLGAFDVVIFAPSGKGNTDGN